MSDRDPNQETLKGSRTRLPWWKGAGLHRRRQWRALRLVLGLGLLMVLLGAGTVMVGLGTRGGRDLLLGLALRHADGALPGTLSVADARWSRLGHLELGGLLWSSEADTLVYSDQIVLNFSVAALRQREIHIHSLKVDGLTADLPGIQTVLPARISKGEVQESGAAAQQASARGLPFFKAGSVGGLPSTVLDSLHFHDLVLELHQGLPLHLLDLHGGLNLRAGEETRAELALRARPRPDMECRWRLAGQGTDTVVLSLHPLLIEKVDDNTRHNIRLDDGTRTPGSLVINASVLGDLLAGRRFWPELTLRDLQITGAVGEYRLSADLVSGGKAQMDFQVAWPSPPVFLPEILSAVRDSLTRDRLLDLLGAAWTGGDSLSAEIQAEIEGLPNGSFRPEKVNLKGELHLPGPAQLASLLPPELDLAGFDGFEVSLVGRADLSGPETVCEAQLDLGETSWLDRGYLDVSGLGDSLEIEALEVKLAGSEIDLQGSFGDEGLDLNGRVRLPDGRLLSRWRGFSAVNQDPYLFLNGRLHVPWPWPDLRHDADMVQLQVDSLALRLAGAEADLRGTLSGGTIDTNASLRLPNTDLLTLWPGELPEDLDLQLDLDLMARGALPHPTGEIALRGTVAVAGLQVPELDIRASHRQDTLDLQMSAPAGLDYQGYELELLQAEFRGELSDSLRQVTGDFRMAAAVAEGWALLAGKLVKGNTISVALDSLQGTYRGLFLAAREPLEIDLDTQEQGLQMRGLDLVGDVGSLRGGGFLSPDSLSFDLDFDLQATAADLNPLLASQNGRRLPESTVRLVGDLQLGGSAPQPVVATRLEGQIVSLDLADTLGSLHGGGYLRPDSMSFDLDFDLQATAADLNPLLYPQGDRQLPEGKVHLAGDLRLGGSAPEPSVAVSVEGEIVSVNQLEELASRVELDLSPTSGLQAQWQIVQRDTTWVEGQIHLPLQCRLNPLTWHLDGNKDFGFTMRTREIALRRLESLWPPGIRTEGRLGCEMFVAGRGLDAEVSGQVRLDQARIRLSDGSWFATEGQVGLGGTLAEPRADGRLELGRGLIRLPDLPPSLLPADGSSLLWEHPLPGDQVVILHAGGALPSGSAPEPRAGPPFLLPDLRIAMHCPGNVWLRGHGLNVELAGDLNSTLRQGFPRLDGQLRAVRGSLNFMGRHFNVDRGLITFYADEAHLDPLLDIILSVSLNGIVYRVDVTGRSQDPELILSSEPPIAAADIISGLLFGRPMSDLDSGQADLMEARSREILASYGSAVLGTRMARQFGVDEITIQQGEGSGDSSRLMVGKYLSPKVRVSYKQVLSTRSAFYVSLSYLLRSYLKINSVVSQGAESGIELMLGKDY